MELIDAAQDLCDCEPFVYMPAWWSSFLFHLVSTRQLAVYTYVAMLGVGTGMSQPTVRQIQEDMGLLSDSVVFDSLRALEDLCLIRRLRKAGAAGQNAYARPACETTLIQLLERNLIDAELRPIRKGTPIDQSSAVTDLARSGLRMLLGDRFPILAQAPPSTRSDVLLGLLKNSLQSRRRGDRSGCVCDHDERAERSG